MPHDFAGVELSNGQCSRGRVQTAGDGDNRTAILSQGQPGGFDSWPTIAVPFYSGGPPLRPEGGGQLVQILETLEGPDSYDDVGSPLLPQCRVSQGGELRLDLVSGQGILRLSLS